MDKLLILAKSRLPVSTGHLYTDYKWLNTMPSSIKTIINNVFDNVHNGTEYDSGIYLCQIVCDFSWEKMNTGHWMDVEEKWKDLYGLFCLCSCIFNLHKLDCTNDNMREELENIIKICDKGILMGSTLFSRTLSAIAFRAGQLILCHIPDIQSQCLERDCNPKISSPESNLPKVKCASSPSIEYFITNHKNLSCPLKITDGLQSWPAFTNRKWTIPYLKRLTGFRTVPVEIGSKYTDHNWSQNLMTMNDFIDSYILKPNDVVAYLAQHNLFDQIPELHKDICIPDYCYSGDTDCIDINSWFGPSSTVSPLHFDPKHNFLCQVIGTKKVRLYSPDMTSYLYPYDSEFLFNTSQIDVENVDSSAFPLFSEAKGLECILGPGDMLYIPPKWWHYVRSLSTSFSVSFWWE